MDNTEKRALLEEAAKEKGIPKKLIDGYTITSHFNLEHAVIELSNEWSNLREFALNGKVIDKKDSDTKTNNEAIRSAMQKEADKLLGNSDTEEQVVTDKHIYR